MAALTNAVKLRGTVSRLLILSYFSCSPAETFTDGLWINQVLSFHFIFISFICRQHSNIHCESKNCATFIFTI